jgi:hypothetical protein
MLMGIGLLAVGCASHQGRRVETSGFLGDYSQLREGTGDEALLTYTNPQTDFRQYDKIILDPIKVYPGVGDSALRTISEEDLQKLVDYFDATLRANLGKSLTFVTEPGPGTMRLRIALTESMPGKVALDTVSSVLPPAVALSALKTVVTGRGTGIGEASAEFEAQDSLTGERLAAAVDKRIGGKYSGNFDKFDKWRASQAAFDYWAERMNERLVELKKIQ